MKVIQQQTYDGSHNILNDFLNPSMKKKINTLDFLKN